MSALSPGLYRATVRGVADVTVMVDGDGLAHTADSVKGWKTHNWRDLRDARPLIVLGAPERSTAFNHYPRLIAYLRRGGWELTADQIEAQTKPARIPEPGAFGVVEAGLNGHTLRRNFVRVDGFGEGIWIWIDRIGSSSGRFTWSYLIDPVLIREGLS
jgi:hypothetical protein